jgi:hypothetical protein
MEYLIGLIVVLLGTVFYTKSKKNSAEGILNNLESLVKDLSLQEKSLEAKAEQTQATKELKELDNEESKAKKDADTSSTDDNLDFWNKSKK